MIVKSDSIDNRLPGRREEPQSSAEIEQAARQRIIDSCPFRFYFRNVEYQFEDGLLTLDGRVPSFYLKQVLQAVLAGLPAIERIDNRVEVVNAVGLSSVRPR